MRRFVLSLGAISVVGSLTTGVLIACGDDDPIVQVASRPDAQADAPVNVQETGSNCPPEPTRSCTNAACTQQAGEPAVCVDNKCVKLKTADCPLVVGPVENDNVLVLGVVHSNRGPGKGTGDLCNSSLQLAVTEMNATGGLPFKDQCKKPRPLAFVACDDTNILGDGGTFADAGTNEVSPREQTLEHLITELKSPVIIGGIFSQDAVSIGSYIIPKHKEMIWGTRVSAGSAIANNPLFTQDGKRLFWRTAQNSDIAARGVRKLFAQVETEARTAHNVPGGTNLKVGLVFKGDAFGQSIREIVRPPVGATQPQLVINGVAYDPGAGAADVVDKTYRPVESPTASTPTGTVTRADLVASLVATPPDVIILISTDEMGAVIKDIELALEPVVGGDLSKMPFYIGGPGTANPLLSQYADTLDTLHKTSLLNRIRALYPATQNQLATDFLQRLRQAVPEATDQTGVRQVYDTAYILGYAMTAAMNDGDGAINTQTIHGKFGNIFDLTAADTVDLGPAKWGTMSKRVAEGTKINTNGTSGPLDFDMAKGEAISDNAVLCLDVDANTNKVYFKNETGQVYLGGTDTLQGTFKCR